jgi:predicted metalloprotease with PDZ domain
MYVKHILIAFAVCTFFLSMVVVADCGPLPKAGPFVSYTIQPKFVENGLTLDVVLAFRISGRSATLILPSEWQGQRDLYRAIGNLEALSSGTAVESSQQPSTRRITFPPGQVVRISYRVSKDWTGKIDSSSYLRVMLEPSYFQVSGPNFLVYPSLPDDAEIPIFIEWHNLPSGWSVVDSLSGNAVCQSAKKRLIKITNGLFVGGVLRINRFEVGGKPVFVATRGQWSFPDDAFADSVRKILTTERSFWHDLDTPNYLVTMLPSDDTAGNYGGTAFEDSFAFFSGPSAKLDFQTRFLLAHEMFHSWNPGKLGEIRSKTPFWFTEGFTDYYARKLLRRAGLATREEYESDIDEAYREYRNSPVVHATGAEVTSRFYTDADIQRLAYLRGNFIALRWDQSIQSRSGGHKSLDDAMLDLFRQAKSRELVLTTAFLAQHFLAFVGSDAISDIQKFIENGDLIPPEVSRESTAKVCEH